MKVAILVALYLITADNIIEIARYNDQAACSAASTALQQAGVHTFCKPAEGPEQ